MNDVAFQLLTGLSPMDCESRIATALRDKVWILTGEPRWESIYMMGSVATGTFLLREHRGWTQSPTYVSGTLLPAKDGTIIEGKFSRDQVPRWLLWILLGGLTLVCVTHLIFVAKDFRSGPFHFRDLMTHSSYRSALLFLVTIGWLSWMGLMLRVVQRRERQALKRFLMKLLEAREEPAKVNYSLA